MLLSFKLIGDLYYMKLLSINCINIYHINFGTIHTLIQYIIHYIDLKKAFDTVNHSILLRKLYAYGIRGSMHVWLESYLTNRMQYTHLKNKQTKKRLICSIPQGSILGPLLFNIYVNDLHRAINESCCIIFAHDTNVFIKHKNYATMMNR